MKFSWQLGRLASCRHSCLREQLVNPDFIEKKQSLVFGGASCAKPHGPFILFLFLIQCFTLNLRSLVYGRIALKFGLWKELQTQKSLFLSKFCLWEKLDFNLFILGLTYLKTFKAICHLWWSEVGVEETGSNQPVHPFSGWQSQFRHGSGGMGLCGILGLCILDISKWVTHSPARPVLYSSS